MSSSYFLEFILIIWSILLRQILWPLAKFAALFSDPIKDQVDARKKHGTTPISLARLRNDAAHCVVFYCSSAGELEQALPLIHILSKEHSCFCHVLMQSASGAKFATATKMDISWSIAPLDSLASWNKIFSVLRPNLTIIVRHELWPSFIQTAKKYGPLILIDAVLPSSLHRQSKWQGLLNLKLKTVLLKQFDLIATVSETDASFFKNCLGVPLDNILVAGDTKYDRVIERAELKKESMLSLRSSIRSSWIHSSQEKILIGGSIYTQDTEWLLEALKAESWSHIKLLLVPHHTDSSTIAKIFDMIQKQGFTVELSSEVNGNTSRNLSHVRVILVDELGKLGLLYGASDFAWIGGAVHQKIHNVLEPAIYGLPILCGPSYQNSAEAKLMANEGLLHVVLHPKDLSSRLEIIQKNSSDLGKKTEMFARSMSGASRKLVQTFNKFLGGVPND